MTSLNDLHHVHKKTASGISVYIMDTWAVIDSEAEAMLQALHSRSTWGFERHLEVLAEKGADNFMSKFYVGYGHKSIGDCGSITLFIEGVSMLGAKAIQDTKLYNGQEASTRYIDFSQQPILNPLWIEKGTKLQEKQRAFYLSLLDPLEEYIKQQYPCPEGTNPWVYDKTIKAKVFDITRWFLPAGCSTNLARHTTLRQVADRVLQLRHHPQPETVEVANTILEAVLERYPNSFSDKKYEETETYLDKARQSYYYHNPDLKKFLVLYDTINRPQLEKYREVFDERPNNKTELPTYLDLIGTVTVEFLLDYGSFRDLQRHRAPYQRMPLLTTELWFNEWYLTSLSPELKNLALQHLEEVKKEIHSLNLTKEQKQYYTPMWYNVSCQMIGTIPAMVYIAELRSSTYVHPTLRQIAITLGTYLQQHHGIKLFLDTQPDQFDTRRGQQDIALK